MFNNIFKVDFSSIAAMLITATLAYYLLLTDSLLFSIDSIIDFSQQFELPTHILVLGLIPIYISAVLFGAVISGIYLARYIRPLINRLS